MKNLKTFEYISILNFSKFKLLLYNEALYQFKLLLYSEVVLNVWQNCL